MAFVSRLLSRSKHEHVVPVHFFAKEVAPPAPKGDKMLKNIFLEENKKFVTNIKILLKEKNPIDPDDSAAVDQYAKVMILMKTLREKTNILRETSPNELGVEAMMMDAMEKVEKELNKPLMRNDNNGITLHMAE
ncbi:hypothetical protein HHK36_001437 [Tetracentron sinense]|uniref:Uncharacterized protein n=1 Tax=Tetracentron sinense TaxID=13715 RepID=A0A834ZTH6_TETSI|nr:hypothetical protein HHK36_001437 [Tetracentron sinense]